MTNDVKLKLDNFFLWDIPNFVGDLNFTEQEIALQTYIVEIFAVRTGIDRKLDEDVNEL